MGKHLARVDGRIGDSEAKKYWYVTDHVGSVRAVTDKDGKKVWSADYLAFGKQYIKDGDFEELHSFTGKEYDPDTGLHYYNARWYDSDLGRFISEDPVADPNNPNLYSYTANNPLRFIDPTGFSLEDTWAEQDAADAENSSYFTESQLADMGYTGGSETDTGGTDGSPNPGGGDGTQNTQKGPAQPVQGVDPNKKPEGDTKNIADDKDKKKTEEMDKVIDKPKPPKDGQDKTQNKKETNKDNKYKPEVEDKSKKNSSWEERWKDAREIKDDKTRKEAQGGLLEERFPGFKYDSDKPTPAITQLEAWIQETGKNGNNRNYEGLNKGINSIFNGIIAIGGGKVITDFGLYLLSTPNPWAIAVGIVTVPTGIAIQGMGAGEALIGVFGEEGPITQNETISNILQEIVSTFGIKFP